MATRVANIDDVRLLHRVAERYGQVEALAPLWVRFPEPFASLGAAQVGTKMARFWIWPPLSRIAERVEADPEAGTALAVLDRLVRQTILGVIADIALNRMPGVDTVVETLATATGAGAYVIHLAHIRTAQQRPTEVDRLLQHGLSRELIQASVFVRPDSLAGGRYVAPAPDRRSVITVPTIDVDGHHGVDRPLGHSPGRPYVAALDQVVLEEQFLLHVPGAGVLSEGVSYRWRYGLSQRSFLLRPSRNEALHTPLAGDDQITRIPSATFFGKTSVHGHFIIEGLERLHAYALAGRSLDPPFLVQDPPRPSYRRLLAALGLPADDDGYAVIRSTRVAIEHLVIGGIGTSLPAVNPDTVQFLHDRGRHAAGVTDGTGRPGTKLYLARGSSMRRRIVNEDAVRDALEARGYRTVQLETLDLIDQIAMIAEASEIVGVHGSALINLIWATPGTRIGVLVPSTWRDWRPGHVEMLFGQFQSVDLDATAIECAPARDERGAFHQFNEDLEVPVAALRRWLGDPQHG
ncbi:glycosyltransferase family 61 protein [Thalassobaculum sp.]|uniref:glycosyltransferase family 61 protein n=1 Tax=Thalassobaculum sp. TaxID=2022740 RepID=UPI0032EB04C5